MPDTFHMNIEILRFAMPSWRPRLHRLFASGGFKSPRPGVGHIQFDEIFDALREIGYSGWVTAEILPEPDPDSAARQAVKFLRTRFPDQFAPKQSSERADTISGESELAPISETRS